MKRFYFYILLFSFTLTQAQSPQSFFKQANEAYKKGDYQTAISLYEKALQSDKVAPELYFNMGNTFYKLNRIAPSIYYYEKALKLHPGDEDIRYNLQLANQMKLDKIDQVPENFFLRLKKRVNRLFNYDTWAWMAVFSAIFGLIIFGIFLFTKNPNIKRITFVGMFLSLFLLLFTWYNADFGYRLSQVKYAIVFNQKSDLMTEPNLTSDVVVNLHEGSKVQVLQADNDWYLVKLPDGKKAWVPKSDIRIIE